MEAKPNHLNAIQRETSLISVLFMAPCCLEDRVVQFSEIFALQCLQILGNGIWIKSGLFLILSLCIFLVNASNADVCA